MLKWPWPAIQSTRNGHGSSVEHPVTPQPAALEDDHALDAFVQVLRSFGQHAFDLERENVAAFAEQCAAWGRHLLNLAPPPVGGLAAPADGDSAGDRDGRAGYSRREWGSVVQFFVTRRKCEQEYVNRALADLRQGIWTFAQSLGSALVEDQRMDTRLQSQIERLKVAVERLPPEELKEEVVAAAANLSVLVSERQRVQAERLEALGAQVADLTGQLHEAKEESVRDPLTKLANRKGFDEFLSRMVFMRDVFAERACLLLIDVERFKTVNDTYGHPGGDAVLRALADCLARNFPRKSDLVARYGGEEFAVILPDTSTPDARRLADRMLMTVRELQVAYGGRVITCTVSVGVGRVGRSESIQDWLDRTDQALYRAKAEGRDRAVEASATE